MSSQYIASKRRVGRDGQGWPIVEMTTQSGLYLVAHLVNGKVIVLGTGPCSSVARFIAGLGERPVELPEEMESKYRSLTQSINALA